VPISFSAYLSLSRISDTIQLPIPHGRKYRPADVGEEVLLEAGNEALRRAVPRVAGDLNRAELIGELDHGGWVVSK